MAACRRLGRAAAGVSLGGSKILSGQAYQITPACIEGRGSTLKQGYEYSSADSTMPDSYCAQEARAGCPGSRMDTQYCRENTTIWL